MLTVSTNYSTAVSKTLTQPGFLVKVGWATPKYFSSRGTVNFTIPGDSLASTFVGAPITVSAINTDVTAKSTGALTIGIDPTNPLQVTQYALSPEYGFANTPIDIWLYDANTLNVLKWLNGAVSPTYIVRSPDSAANSITDDIDIRADILSDYWISGIAGIMASKDETAGQQSWRFQLQSAGYLFFSFSLNGTTDKLITSTALHNFSDGTRHWVRVTRIALTGVITFYTSTDGLYWTQLGNPITESAGPIYDSTSSQQIGSYRAGSGSFVGKIYRVQVYNGIAGTPYLLLKGVSGCYASTPDAAVNSITGDIDIRCDVNCDDWTPGAVVNFVAKRAAVGQASYRLYMDVSGALAFEFSTDGTTLSAYASTINNSFTNGTRHWVRVTRTSASGNIKFYTSDDGVTWTQFGATVSGATGSIFNSTSVVELGSVLAGTTQQLAGKIYRAQILNGIDGQKVVDFNLTGVTSSPATITSPTTGEVWTLNGSSKIGGVLAVDFNPMDATVGTGPFTSATTGETWTMTGAGGGSYQQNSVAELNVSDTIKIFNGIGDSVTLDALELKTTLIPVNLISSVSPRVRINPRNGFNYIQPRGTVVNWGTDRFTLE